MNALFSIGEVVRTVKGSAVQGEGTVRKIFLPSGDLQLLWGEAEYHYLVKDCQSGEFISVTERGLEKV